MGGHPRFSADSRQVNSQLVGADLPRHCMDGWLQDQRTLAVVASGRASVPGTQTDCVLTIAITASQQVQQGDPVLRVGVPNAEASTCQGNLDGSGYNSSRNRNRPELNRRPYLFSFQPE